LHIVPANPFLRFERKIETAFMNVLLS